jgi:phospholipid/cholesterol/gamma-HCH transport system substrate-binding protein
VSRHSIQQRNIRIAQVLLLVIGLLGIAYLGDSVVGGSVFRANRTFTVQLPSGGGLYPGSTVTYRGSSVGEVTSVRLVDSGVEATARVDGDTRIPVDTEAVVANLSAIGEQYLDFRPRSDGGPFLADGAVIGRDHSRVPMRIDTLLTNVAELSERIDTDDLRTVTTEMGAAFDTDTDLVALGGQASRALGTLEELQPALRSLMTHSRVPLRTVVDHSDDLRTFSSDIEKLTAQVEKSDPTLRTMLDGANTLAPLADDLVVDITPDLGTSVTQWGAFAKLASDRLPGYDHWLTWAPDQMTGMYESTRDGAGRVLLVPNPSKTCDYGGKKASPFDTTRTPADTEARCTTVDPFVQQRGAQYVPRPGS